MIDTRALTWTALLPADSGYTWVNLPDSFRAIVDASDLRDGDDVLCLWSPTVDDLARANVERFDTLVLINPVRINLRTLQDAGFAHLRRYAVAPGLADARWFMPQGNAGITSAALGAYLPYKASARVKKRAAQLAMRMHFLRWYRDEVVVASRAVPALEQALATPFPGEDIRLAFSTGTPGPARKPVAHVLNSKGKILAYAKIGMTDTSARLVRREGDLLRSLAADERTAKHVPKLLFDGDAGGRPAIMLSPVAGRPGSRKSSPAHQHFLSSMRNGHTRPVTASTQFKTVHRRIETLADDFPRLAHQALETVRPTLDDLRLPSTIAHGDFAPWNVRVDAGHLHAFDWENGELDAVPLMDELHHALQVGFLLEGWSVPQAFAYMRSVQSQNSLGLPANQAAGIEVLYLLDALSRRLEEGHPLDEQLNQRYSALLSLHTDVRALERIGQ